MGIHRKISGTINRAAITASGSESITGIGGKPHMVLFNAVDDSDSNTFSMGWDEGALKTCVFTQVLVGLLNLLGSTGNFAVAQLSQTNSIQIQNASGNGHSANISSMDSDGFTLNWTRIANGRAITVKYLAIL